MAILQNKSSWLKQCHGFYTKILTVSWSSFYTNSSYYQKKNTLIAILKINVKSQVAGEKRE